jgi:hypothetical protein
MLASGAFGDCKTSKILVPPEDGTTLELRGSAECRDGILKLVANRSN